MPVFVRATGLVVFEQGMWVSDRSLRGIERLEEEGLIDAELCCRRASLLAELNEIRTNEE